MKKPKIVYHPGETLRDEIDARAKTCKCCGHVKQYSLGEFAKDVGMDQAQISMLINGKRNFTPLMAKRISKVLGTKPTFWVGMQMSYDLWKLEQD